MSNVDIELKVIAKQGERQFEQKIDFENGIRINSVRNISSLDIQEALTRYVLQNCDDEVILKALVSNSKDKKSIVYNPNLTQEMADSLVDELCHEDDGGRYPYEFYVILRNPCVSGKKLDTIVNKFLEQYKQQLKNGKGENYELIYILQVIASNIAIWESTLETLKRSNIAIVAAASKR